DVILLAPGLKTLKIIQRVRGNENTWQPSEADLTEFIGQSFYIYFNVYNDGNPARTWMFLDSVSLEVCTSPLAPSRHAMGGPIEAGGPPAGGPGGHPPKGGPPPYVPGDD